MTPAQQTFLRRLTLGDTDVAVATFATSLEASQPLGLDACTFALARVAALIATDAPLTTYQWAVDAALAAGASEGDLVDVTSRRGSILLPAQASAEIGMSQCLIATHWGEWCDGVPAR